MKIQGIFLIVLSLIIIAAVGWMFVSRYEIRPRSDVAETPATVVNYDDSKTFRLGEISEKIKKNQDEYKSLADYLKVRLKNKGIQDTKVVIAGTVSEMAALIRQNKQDLVMENPFNIFLLKKLSSCEIILSRSDDSGKHGKSVIFANKSSKIKSLADLKGQMIAFTEPSSSEGYLLPKAELLSMGYKLTYKQSTSESVSPDEIGYVFVNDDDFVPTYILKGKVAAGAIEEEDYEDNVQDTGDIFTVIFKTVSVPKHLVCVRSGLDQGIKDDVRDILSQMGDTTEGRKVLQDSGKDQFYVYNVHSPEAVNLEKLTNLVEQDTLHPQY